MLTENSTKPSNGNGPIGSKMVCGNCSLALIKVHKRQKYCGECSVLSRNQNLPHQIEGKRKYARDRAERMRRARGDRLFKGVVVPCERCQAPVVTKGIGQKYCEPCRDIAAKERDHRLDRRRRIRRGVALVGTEIVCRGCASRFVKVGVNQAFCTPECKKLHWAADPRWTINRRMSAGVKSSLVDAKNGRSWESLVGYTVLDLMAHLERQFLRGMTWDNRGKWHIDHIQPLKSFTFSSPDDDEFRAAWALTNLQPLWATDNLTKGGRRTQLL